MRTKNLPPVLREDQLLRAEPGERHRRHMAGVGDSAAVTEFCVLARCRAR